MYFAGLVPEKLKCLRGLFGWTGCRSRFATLALSNSEGTEVEEENDILDILQASRGEVGPHMLESKSYRERE